MAKNRAPRKLSADDVDLTVDAESFGFQSTIELEPLDEIVGQRAKARIRRGSVLRREMFEPVPVVHRGDIVTIFVETESFRITAPGEVLEEGGEGDVVRVCNLTSKNKVYGFVRDSKQVEVKY